MAQLIFSPSMPIAWIDTLTFSNNRLATMVPKTVSLTFQFPGKRRKKSRRANGSRAVNLFKRGPRNVYTSPKRAVIRVCEVVWTVIGMTCTLPRAKSQFCFYRRSPMCDQHAARIHQKLHGALFARRLVQLKTKKVSLSTTYTQLQSPFRLTRRRLCLSRLF